MSENILQKIIDQKKTKIEKLKLEIDINRLLHAIRSLYQFQVLIFQFYFSFDQLFSEVYFQTFCKLFIYLNAAPDLIKLLV